MTIRLRLLLKGCWLSSSYWSPNGSRASLHSGQLGKVTPSGKRGRPSQKRHRLLKSLSGITLCRARLGIAANDAVASGPSWLARRTWSRAVPLEDKRASPRLGHLHRPPSLLGICEIGGREWLEAGLHIGEVLQKNLYLYVHDLYLYLYLYVSYMLAFPCNLDSNEPARSHKHLKQYRPLFWISRLRKHPDPGKAMASSNSNGVIVAGHRRRSKLPKFGGIREVSRRVRVWSPQGYMFVIEILWSLAQRGRDEVVIPKFMRLNFTNSAACTTFCCNAFRNGVSKNFCTLKVRSTAASVTAIENKKIANSGLGLANLSLSKEEDSANPI